MIARYYIILIRPYVTSYWELLYGLTILIAPASSYRFYLCESEDDCLVSCRVLDCRILHFVLYAY